MAKKTVTAGNEYEVLKTKSRAAKIFLTFTLAWALLVVAPLAWILYRNASAVQRFAIVSAVSEMNGFVLEQTAALEDRLLKAVDVNKFAGKIKVPSIDASGLIATVDKANAQVSALTKQVEGVNASVGRIQAAAKLVRVDVSPINLGSLLGSMNEVSNATNNVKAQVNKANEQMKSSLDQAAKTLATDFNEQIRKEVSGVGAKNMQKALNLSDASFALLVRGDYGVFTEKARANTARIYAEFEKTSVPVVKQIMSAVRAYWSWISIVLTLVFVGVMIIPVIIAAKIKKMFTDFLDRCPYCGKVFISKRAKTNIFKYIKFW